MGLDTSHDCWHGPYSMFMRWRTRLHYYLHCGLPYDDPHFVDAATRENYVRALDDGWYEDQSVPINVLMNHSDCDGEITPDVCGPLADRLEQLIADRMPASGTYDEMRPPTERFIAGLRCAAAAGETVVFG